MSKLERMGAGMAAGLLCYLPCPFFTYVVAVFIFDSTDPSDWDTSGRVLAVFIGLLFAYLLVGIFELGGIRKSIAKAFIEGLSGDEE